MRSLLIAAAAAVSLAAGSVASAATVNVSVSATAGPYDPVLNSSLDYGEHDQTAATTITVAAGQMLTINYLSGLTSAFYLAPPTEDAAGYTYEPFGSGTGLTGIGSSGNHFPSYHIDPDNTGSDIYLAELIGAFADSNGDVIGTPFAVGNGPYSVTAPAGATRLQLGLNDDIFSDNSGSLTLEVSGVSAAPEPGIWVMMFGGVGIAGLALRRRKEQNGSAFSA